MAFDWDGQVTHSLGMKTTKKLKLNIEISFLSSEGTRAARGFRLFCHTVTDREKLDGIFCAESAKN